MLNDSEFARLDNLFKEVEQEYNNIGPQFTLAEVNLLTLPMFTLEKQPVGGTISVRLRQGDHFLIWKVAPHPEFGLPRPRDRLVHRAIEGLLLEEHPIPKEFKFSIFEVLKRLKWPQDGRNYRQVRQALRRVSTTSIEAQHAFAIKTPEGRRIQEITPLFTLYDVVFKGEHYRGRVLREANLLLLGELYYRSLIHSYVKPLDWDYYLELIPLAQRLYELLGVKFFGLRGKRALRYNYRTLCQLLPIRPQRYPSKAKQILEPAHKQLLETKFLSRAEWEITERGWYLHYEPGARYWAEVQFAASRPGFRPLEW